MKGLQLTAYGDPSDVVELADLPEVGAPGPDEVVIDVEASPVEPTDLYTIAGSMAISRPCRISLVARASGVSRLSAGTSGT